MVCGVCSSGVLSAFKLNSLEYGERALFARVVFFCSSRVAKEFGKRSSYLKPSSEMELDNTDFNKTSNENNFKKIQANRSTELGKTHWEAYGRV